LFIISKNTLEDVVDVLELRKRMTSNLKNQVTGSGTG
jgi:hypothetical protein